MIVKNDQQTIEWLYEIGVTSKEGELNEERHRNKSAYRIPDAAGRKTYLAKILTSIFEKYNQICIYVTEYGVWPSSENFTLFNGFRKSIGIQKEIHDIPCMIFDGSELENAFAILNLVLYFSWGAIVCGGTRLDPVIKISHDDFVEIHSNEIKILDGFENIS